MRAQLLLLAPSVFLIWSFASGGCSGITSPSTEIVECGTGDCYRNFPAGVGGNAGAAGQATAAGGGGEAGKAGVSGQAGGSAGKSGSSGASAAAGTGGTSPEAAWVKVGDVPDSTVEELVNPEKHRLFSWGPCEWTDNPDCEQMVLDPIAPLHEFGGLGVQVHDDGVQVRVAMVVSRTEVAGITDEEGHILRAFRQPWPSSQVWFSSFRVYQNHFALPILNKNNPTPVGMLGRLNQPELTFFKPVWPSPELGAGSQGYVLNSKRWGMWISQAAMVSLDAFQGNPIGVFSHTDYDAGLLSINGLTATDHHLLSVEWWMKEGNSRPRIVVSDGLQKAKPLFSPLPDGDDGNPMFANTHIGWFRGHGYKDLNLYEKVELWGSPISSNADGLQPFKVMDLNTKNASYVPILITGGWGRVLFLEGSTKEHFARVVDLTKKHEPLLISLPSQLTLASGVTRTHAWFGLGKIPPRQVVRWKLPPGGSGS